jgi:hypothetical protein
MIERRKGRQASEEAAGGSTALFPRLRGMVGVGPLLLLSVFAALQILQTPLRLSQGLTSVTPWEYQSTRFGWDSFMDSAARSIRQGGLIFNFSAVAQLCNPASRSCECLERWTGEEACHQAKALIQLGRRRMPPPVVDKPIVRLSAIGSLGMRLLGPYNTSGQLHDCEESVCLLVKNKVKGVDGLIASCDDGESIPARTPWQRGYVVGLGAKPQCYTEKSGWGADVWAGDTLHEGVDEAMFTSWVNVPPVAFELAPLPTQHKRAEALVPVSHRWVGSPALSWPGPIWAHTHGAPRRMPP